MFGLEKSKDFGTPTSTSMCLETDASRKYVDEKMYTDIVGSLLYVTVNRPDIMYNVHKFARFHVASKK